MMMMDRIEQSCGRIKGLTIQRKDRVIDLASKIDSRIISKPQLDKLLDIVDHYGATIRIVGHIWITKKGRCAK